MSRTFYRLMIGEKTWKEECVWFPWKVPQWKFKEWHEGQMYKSLDAMEENHKWRKIVVNGAVARQRSRSIPLIQKLSITTIPLILIIMVHSYSTCSLSGKRPSIQTCERNKSRNCRGNDFRRFNTEICFHQKYMLKFNLFNEISKMLPC